MRESARVYGARWRTGQLAFVDLTFGLLFWRVTRTVGSGRPVVLYRGPFRRTAADVYALHTNLISDHL